MPVVWEASPARDLYALPALPLVAFLAWALVLSELLLWWAL